MLISMAVLFFVVRNYDVAPFFEGSYVIFDILRIRLGLVRVLIGDNLRFRLGPVLVGY